MCEDLVVGKGPEAKNGKMVGNGGTQQLSVIIAIFIFNNQFFPSFLLITNTTTISGECVL